MHTIYDALLLITLAATFKSLPRLELLAAPVATLFVPYSNNASWQFCLAVTTFVSVALALWQIVESTADTGIACTFAITTSACLGAHVLRESRGNAASNSCGKPDTDIGGPYI